MAAKSRERPKTKPRAKPTTPRAKATGHAPSAAKSASKATARTPRNKAAAGKPPAQRATATRTSTKKAAAQRKAQPKAKADSRPSKAVKAKAAGKPESKPSAQPKAISTARLKPKAPAPRTKAQAAKTATRNESPVKKSRDSAQQNMKIRSKAAPATAAKSAGAAADSPFKNFRPYEPKKNEDYMSDEQLAHFRSILLKWRQELMEEVDRTVHHMRDEAANFPDPADRATQEEEFSIELRTRDRERKLIKKIDQTIDRLDQHDFGYCDTCGVEIGLRRLEARPTASQCVDCKSLDEIKERQLHG
jgi:DnaK suppressor protein